MRWVLVGLTLAILACSISAASAKLRRVPRSCSSVPAWRLCAVHHHVRHANQSRLRMGQSRLRYLWRPERAQTAARRDRYLSYWYGVDRKTTRLLKAYRARIQSAPWLQSSWYQAAMCVHSHEGAWNDPNAPYWGGMQMDLSFQQAYGPEFLARYGTADHWPAADQLHAAYRAWQSRGWSPWPNTAAMCGLL